MNKPTGKLAMAYATIAKMEARINELEAPPAAALAAPVQHSPVLTGEFLTEIHDAVADEDPVSDSSVCNGDVLKLVQAVRTLQIQQLTGPDSAPASVGELDPFGFVHRVDGEPLIKLNGDPRIKDGMPVYGADEVARLQAEVERLRTDSQRLDFILLKCRKVVVERVPGGSQVYVEEGFMSDKTYPSIDVAGEWKNDSAEALQVRRRAIDAALPKGKCCVATPEEQALLASGEYTPEELWGGSSPSCPECHGQKAVPGTSQEPGKPCAAEWQGHQCSAPRAQGSLFCPQHRSVDGRQSMGGDPLTNEQLAHMMQRDGEIQ
ncbi:hypothetical protein NRB16_07815 [Pseudomonas sp. LJDD11]|uniref:hypothetical protein n=1 Tax=Pseudomonas sp. LJDD11 TaxID=2931984 RepID=UPI00211B9CDD|nr:hypothetical protein [Pseudomonas sp. LJDD11]MCQ9423426.1 hypothetical protein [Pseudomonas sp. LJDD11]